MRVHPAARVLAAAAGAGAGALVVPNAYLLALTLLATRTRAPVPAPPGDPLRLAVLVPAHNESAVIERLLESLTTSGYPRDRLRVVVVADHCTDDTVARSRAAGAEVLEHLDPSSRGKGAALTWAIGELERPGPEVDAFVVVDADTTVDPGFVDGVDRCLRAGALVVQGYYATDDPDASPATSLRAVALALRHYVRPLGRTAIGGTAGLFGNGMAFRREVLAAHGFSSHLTEDLELAVDLLLHGIPVAFVPEARVAAEMPTTLEAATTQNARWERGRLDVARRKVGPLLRAAVAGPGLRRRVACVDAAVDLAVPPLSALAALNVASATISVAALAASRRRSAAVAVGSALVANLALAAHVAIGLRVARVPPSTVRALVHLPRYVAWKVGLLARSVVPGAQVAWVRTARNAETR